MELKNILTEKEQSAFDLLGFKDVDANIKLICHYPIRTNGDEEATAWGNEVYTINSSSKKFKQERIQGMTNLFDSFVEINAIKKWIETSNRGLTFSYYIDCSNGLSKDVIKLEIDKERFFSLMDNWN